MKKESKDTSILRIAAYFVMISSVIYLAYTLLQVVNWNTGEPLSLAAMLKGWYEHNLIAIVLFALSIVILGYKKRSTQKTVLLSLICIAVVIVVGVILCGANVLRLQPVFFLSAVYNIRVIIPDISFMPTFNQFTKEDSLTIAIIGIIAIVSLVISEIIEKKKEQTAKTATLGGTYASIFVWIGVVALVVGGLGYACLHNGTKPLVVTDAIDKLFDGMIPGLLAWFFAPNVLLLAGCLIMLILIGLMHIVPTGCCAGHDRAMMVYSGIMSVIMLTLYMTRLDLFNLMTALENAIPDWSRMLSIVGNWWKSGMHLERSYQVELETMKTIALYVTCVPVTFGVFSQWSCFKMRGPAVIRVIIRILGIPFYLAASIILTLSISSIISSLLYGLYVVGIIAGVIFVGYIVISIFGGSSSQTTSFSDADDAYSRAVRSNYLGTLETRLREHEYLSMDERRELYDAVENKEISSFDLRVWHDAHGIDKGINEKYDPD